MLRLDYVEVEIRQEKSKYKIRETGSIMKILLILLPHRIFPEPKNSNPTGKAIPFRMIGFGRRIARLKRMAASSGFPEFQ